MAAGNESTDERLKRFSRFLYSSFSCKAYDQLPVGGMWTASVP